MKQSFTKQIKFFQFGCRKDVGEVQAEIWVHEYAARGQTCENAFKDYCWTLDLSYGDETELLALGQLALEVSRRGW